MNVDKLLAALIIAVTLADVFGVGVMISKALYLLPSPWDVVSGIVFGVLGLTVIVYVWLGKLERKKKGGSHGEERL